MPDTHTRTQHTPGPWDHGSGVRQYHLPDGTCYRAEIGSRDYAGRSAAIFSVPMPDAEDIANLTLAQAAPDLLAALEAIAINADFDDDDMSADLGDRLLDIERMARAAIRKARGEE